MGYKKFFLWCLLLLTLGGCNTGVKHSLNPSNLGRGSSVPTNVYRPLGAASNTNLLGQWVSSPDGHGSVVYVNKYLPNDCFATAPIIVADAKKAARAADDSLKRANVARTKADIAFACVMRDDGVPVTSLAYSWAAYIVATASASFARAVSNASFAAEYAYACAAVSAHAAIAASDRAAAIVCSATHAVNSNMRSVAASAASAASAAYAAADGARSAAAYVADAAHAVETIGCIRRASGSSNASSDAFYEPVDCTVSAHADSSSNTASRAAVYAYAAHAASCAAFACCAYADAVLNVIFARLEYDRVIKDCETPMLRKIVKYLRKISSVNIHMDIASAAVSRACAAISRGRSAAADSAVDAVVAVTVDDAAVAAARAAVYFASAARSAAANAAALVSTVRLPAARAATAVDTM